MVYSFQAKVATRGYHVYQNTTWDQATVGDKVWVKIESDKKSKEIDLYCCSIRTSANQQMKTVGHFPREISRHIYFFLKDEHGHTDGTVKSIDYRPSPIPDGGLEIPLTLNLKFHRYITHTKMKEFMSTLYSLDYNGNKEDERDNPTGTPRRIDVDSTCILRRYVKDQISTNFHVFSTYFFDVISLVEKSTSFPRTFFDVISIVEKSTLFPRTFFDVISMVEKSTLFPRTFFDVISFVETSTVSLLTFFDVILMVE